jgi:hypothetical protein
LIIVCAQILSWPRFPVWRQCFLATIPIAIVLFFLFLQPDFGMILLIIITFGIQLFIFGMPLRGWVIAGCIMGILATVSYCTLPHVARRFDHFWTAGNKDPYGESFQILKSLSNATHEVITSVCFKLTKKNHKVSTTYGAIETELQHQNIQNPTLKDVSNAVIAIRQSKLPDPKELGNSGSFFKNPIISKELFEKVQQKFPEVKFFEVSSTEVKVPAGWLIEHSGLKGYRKDDAGVHKNQALVLVNYGNATGQDILNLSKYVQKTVFDKYGIEIEAEVNVI